LFPKTPLTWTKVIAIFIAIIVSTTLVTAISVYTIKIPSTGTIKQTNWSIESVAVFPFSYYYSERGTDNLLVELRNRLPEIHYVDIRTYWQPDASNPDNLTFSGGPIGYMGEYTHSISELEIMINKTRANGLDIMLWACKDPGVPAPNPQNWSVWFDNYAEYIKGIAEWAESKKIPLFVFGAEYEAFMGDSLNALLGSGYTNEWNHVISEIRSVYSGKIIYGINWWSTAGQWDVIYNQATWLASLDFIQIDSYQSLGKNLYDRINATEIAKCWNPTIQDLMGNWTSNRYGPNFNYPNLYQALSDKYDKKIIINVGFRNNNGTSTMPWKNVPNVDLSGNPVPGWGADTAEMSDCWEAFFLTWANNTSIIGLDLEHYSQPDTNGLNGSFRGKYDPVRQIGVWEVIEKYL
jgi:hypothetical protein